MTRTVTTSALAFAAMALTLACSISKGASTVDESPAQTPTIVAQILYDQYDQSFSNHDVKQLLDFYDPSFTLVDVKGKRIGFAEYRKQETDTFNNAQLRNFKKKTTIKDVQLQRSQLVVYYEAEMHFEYQDQKSGWESLIQTSSGETTWQRTGGRWKLVMGHVLRTNLGLDPQWAAMRRQQLENSLKAVDRASSVLVPCNYSYNGCR